jgi:hypothetical protein
MPLGGIVTNRNAQDDPALSEFIEVLAELTTDFTAHPESPRLRIPLRPVPLDPVCDHVGLDPANDPHSVSRTLFSLEWDSGPGFSSCWFLFALRLPSGERAYWVDDADGRKIIAVGPGGIGADRRFVRALFKDNGESFGTGVLDSAPSRVYTNIRGDVLIDAFLDAFSASSNAWQALDCSMRIWLKKVLTKGGKELTTLTRDQLQREFIARVEGLVTDFGLHPAESRVGIPPCPTSPYAAARSLKKKLGPLLRSVSYQLFQFAWWSVPGSTSVAQIGAILLPDKSRVFWIYVEGDGTEEIEYSIAGTAGPEVNDLHFLQLLFARNGKDFGVEVCGCAPLEIITPLQDIPELPDLFVAAYNGFPQAWESLSDYQPEDHRLDHRDPPQARELVVRHLNAVTHNPHRPSIG